MGGKKAKKAKNHNPALTGGKRTILWAEQDQIYGRVDKILGDMRCSVLCHDGQTRVCKIRGKMRKRVWINMGDIVLVCLRDFQDGKADIIHKYTPSEAVMLKEQGEFDPEAIAPSVKREIISMEDIVAEIPAKEENHQDSDFIDFSTI